MAQEVMPVYVKPVSNDKLEEKILEIKEKFNKPTEVQVIEALLYRHGFMKASEDEIKAALRKINSRKRKQAKTKKVRR